MFCSLSLWERVRAMMRCAALTLTLSQWERESLGARGLTILPTERAFC